MFCCLESHAQFVVGSRYKAQTFDEMAAPLLMYKQAFDQFNGEVNSMVDYISDILSQNIDSQMRDLMTKRYNQAINISKKLNSNGFSQNLRTEFSTLTRNVKSDVVAYNNRIAKEREEAERRMQEAERKRQEELQSPSNWSGSGFALKNGYVTTNYHVIEGANSITIKGINGDFNKAYNASVVATDRFNDLAILKIDDNSFNGYGTTPYSVKTVTSEVGEDIFVLGYPLTATMGDEIKYTTGVISSKTGFQGDVSLYQISAPIQPGNSGGPLFDSKGNLIGIVNAKHNGAENVGYAIKSSYLRNLVESFTAESLLPNTNSLSSKTRTEQIKSIERFVYLIECSKNSRSYTYNGNTNNISSSQSTGKTYSNPTVTRNMGNNLKVISVTLEDNQTKIVISDNNSYAGGYYGWVQLDPQAYIRANGQNYKLTKVDGVALSPNKTYFSYENQTITFTLYFPAIPSSTTSIDFIESETSAWRLYGIQLR